MGLRVWFAWASGTPGLPDLPVLTGISPPDPGWLNSPRGYILLGVLTVAFGAVGYFLSRQFSSIQFGTPALWRSRPARTRPEPKRPPRSTKGGREPLLRIPDPDRRVGIADVRLLQRFGAGVDFRRVLGPFHAEVDVRLPQGTPVILCVECQGPEPQEVVLELEGEPAALEFDSGPGDVERRHWIRYAYLPDRHGSPMRFTLKYRTSQGAMVTDHYQTRHGFRELEFVEAPESGSGGSATVNPSVPMPRSTPSLQIVP